MSLTVLDPGLSTTVQDLGRDGHRAFGVPLGGAFDGGSAALANALLGNDLADAVLEMTLRGGRFRADVALAVALAGAEVEVKVQRAPGSWDVFVPPAAIALCEGDEIAVGWMRRGARTYLAVRGGFQMAMVLGSRSSEDRLAAGASLPCRPSRTPGRRLASPVNLADGDVPLRVIAGPDAGLLTASAFDARQVWQVDPRSDRMGLRLVGPRWDVAAESNRLSAPVCPGTVQLAGGQPLILGVAAGTMGGYPHVLSVVSADLDRLGQARPGDRVRFELVSLEAARNGSAVARRDARSAHQRLAAACRDGVVWLDGRSD